MTGRSSETDELVEHAARGDRRARQQLLVRHRDRLSRMVQVRMDRRLAARVDPSDVVQEVLTEAANRLSDYLRKRPVAFYAWLRQIAWDRLVDLHRHHIGAQRRSVTREEPLEDVLPDESAVQLARRLVESGTGPSRGLIRAELRERVQAALKALAPHDREVIVMRYLEQLSVAEIATVLGLTERGVKSRHMRALLRLRQLLTDRLSEPEP